MFDPDSLLVHIAHPTRKPASPRETPSSTASEYAGDLPATHPQAPATYPQASTPLAGDLRVMRVDAGNLPAHDNAVQDEEKPNLAGLRVGGVFARQQPTRDPDPAPPPNLERLSEDATVREELLTDNGYQSAPNLERLSEDATLGLAWDALEQLPEAERPAWRARLNRERLAAARELLRRLAAQPVQG